ncbi:TetR/AcrR family transcriptional regulator [Paucibacter sp. XJ19-41]|uniref:TetR/AcrR family transcriptional regulator n=1 Tax=Paucibacter sp. XJ19-41 TaxID=2927824 RepID=UPI002349BB39|nr:TetR/AcrR family transcriptional regulator [Paucibacter sp. XJ19-41]MDC6169157.1 TetR/AcrR family transcriptional regulator [Paucibacter sp. XJ19-41]
MTESKARRTSTARKASAKSTHAPSPAASEELAPQPRAARLRKEAAICAEAERQFAQYGFEGASLENIAAAVGISRHSLLYYYPSKEQLYRKVLDEVLSEWLARMAGIVSGTDPEAAMREYIAAKLRYSRERPAGSQVFAREVMAGAPRFRDAIEAQVLPALNADVKTFERWARQGLVAKLDFRHLMFTIWASTQAYADLGPQFAILLGKPVLEEEDYLAAERLILQLVLGGLMVKP